MVSQVNRGSLTTLTVTVQGRRCYPPEAPFCAGPKAHVKIPLFGDGPTTWIAFASWGNHDPSPAGANTVELESFSALHRNDDLTDPRVAFHVAVRRCVVAQSDKEPIDLGRKASRRQAIRNNIALRAPNCVRARWSGVGVPEAFAEVVFPSIRQRG
jgi:hypothetical protein